MRRPRPCTGCAGTTSSRRPTQLLRQRAPAGGREGARHQGQPRDGQRQRPAAAHHRGDPVGRRPRHLHALQQPPAALRRRASSTCQRRRRGRSARRRAATTRSRQGNSQRRQEVAVDAVVCIVGAHDRLPQVVVRRGRRTPSSPRPGTSTARPARSSRPRASRSARRSATPSATRRPSPIRCCGPAAARRSTTSGKVVDQLQGDDRVGQVHDRRSGRTRCDEGGLAWDDSNNNRAFLSGTISRHAERRLDLHRVAAQARPVQDREGRAAEHRHPARAAAQGAGRPVRHAHLPVAHGDEAIRRTRRRRRSSCSGCTRQANYEKWFNVAEGLRHRPDARVGEAHDVGARTR